MKQRRILAIGMVAALVGCTDATMGPVDGGTGGRGLQVELDGPISALGSWRYHDGVRLLECDVRLTAEAWGGSGLAQAEWEDGVVDLYDLRSGRYLGTDYFHPGDMGALWGSRWIASGERRTARTLRYTSYASFTAYVEFYYRAHGELRSAAHRFDCR